MPRLPIVCAFGNARYWCRCGAILPDFPQPPRRGGGSGQGRVDPRLRKSGSGRVDPGRPGFSEGVSQVGPQAWFYSASVRRAPRSCAQPKLRPVTYRCCRTRRARRASIRRHHDVVVPQLWCARRARLARPGGAARVCAACSALDSWLSAAALVYSGESALGGGAVALRGPHKPFCAYPLQRVSARRRPRVHCVERLTRTDGASTRYRRGFTGFRRGRRQCQ